MWLVDGISVHRLAPVAQHEHLLRHGQPLAGATAAQVLRQLRSPIVGIQTSETFQSLPGIAYYATYMWRPCADHRHSAEAWRSARIVRSPSTKTINNGRTKVQGMFNVYDLLNGSAILSENNCYGADAGHRRKSWPG